MSSSKLATPPASFVVDKCHGIISLNRDVTTKLEPVVAEALFVNREAIPGV
uniref:Uncharacterized protein n=1 Tax=Fagus sylvatica TaxID=28930 RepID=A0A2N9H7I5_FAGSY